MIKRTQLTVAIHCYLIIEDIMHEKYIMTACQEGLILRKGYSLGWAIPSSGWMIIFWHVFSQLKTFKTCSLVKLTSLLEKSKKIYAIKELFQGCVLCILKLSNKILHYDSTTIVHILTLSFWGNCCLCLRFLDLDTAKLCCWRRPRTVFWEREHLFYPAGGDKVLNLPTLAGFIWVKEPKLPLVSWVIKPHLSGASPPVSPPTSPDGGSSDGQGSIIWCLGAHVSEPSAWQSDSGGFGFYSLDK